MIHATWGRIRAVYFLTPFPSSKKLVVRSTRNYALSWKAPEGAATFGADLDLCPIAEFSNGQFGFFSSFSHSPQLAKFLERSRNSQNRRLPNRPGFQPIAALLGSRRAGHVPPSPDFRPFALSFGLELPLIGLRLCFSV